MKTVRSAKCEVRTVPERRPHLALRTPHLYAARGAITLLTVLVAAPLWACPVCFGSPDDPMVKSTANGVWVLIGIIAFVQIGLVAMFFSFWWRARQQKRFRDQFHVIDGGQHP